MQKTNPVNHKEASLLELLLLQALLAVCSRFTEIKLYRKIAQNK